MITASEALAKLQEGNKKYIEALTNDGDISKAIRQDTCDNGQFPYAVVLTCSDSRVVPEHIFMCGLGEIFTIRVAGNVVTETQLGSAVYSCDHLGSKLILVLGHTHCGAVGAAIGGGAHGCVGCLTDKIKEAIGDETDDYAACKLNVEASVAALLASSEVSEIEGIEVKGAIYNIDTGVVDFL